MAFSNWRITRRLVTGVSSSRHRTLIQLLLFAATVLTHSLLFGFAIGLAITTMLLMHELGHLIMVKAYGIRHEGILFMPPIGAGVVAEYSKSRLADAVISAAGPTAGLLSAAAMLAIGVWRDEDAWALLAFLNATMNLVNLVPSQSYDGGSMLRSAVGSLPTTTSWFTTLVTAAAVMAVAVTTAYLTGNLFTSIIVIMFALLLPRSAKAFVKDKERLEDLARSLDAEPRRGAVVARLAEHLMAETKNGSLSLDDGKSLHDILEIEPGSFKNESQARRRVAEKLNMTPYEDQLPMTALQARLTLAGYVALIIALIAVSHLALQIPESPRSAIELLGGMAGLIVK